MTTSIYRNGNQRVEVRRNDDGTVDEIVARRVDVHIEQMSDTEFWADIGGVRCVWFTKRATIRLTAEPDFPTQLDASEVETREERTA